MSWRQLEHRVYHGYESSPMFSWWYDLRIWQFVFRYVFMNFLPVLIWQYWTRNLLWFECESVGRIVAWNPPLEEEKRGWVSWSKEANLCSVGLHANLDGSYILEWMNLLLETSFLKHHFIHSVNASSHYYCAFSNGNRCFYRIWLLSGPHCHGRMHGRFCSRSLWWQAVCVS